MLEASKKSDPQPQSAGLQKRLNMAFGAPEAALAKLAAHMLVCKRMLALRSKQANNPVLSDYLSRVGLYVSNMCKMFPSIQSIRAIPGVPEDLDYLVARRNRIYDKLQDLITNIRNDQGLDGECVGQLAETTLNLSEDLLAFHFPRLKQELHDYLSSFQCPS